MMAASRQRTTYRYSIEGNIGIGKTTILNRIRLEVPLCQVVPEPVEAWKNLPSNLVKNFYESPKEYSFRMQTFVALTMSELHKKPLDNPLTPVVISDRCLYSCKPFVRVASQKKWLDASDLIILEQLMKQQQLDEPHTYIYIREDPKSLLKRIDFKDKMIPEEFGAEYINKIHRAHDDWLLHMDQLGKVIVINNPVNFESAYEQVFHIVSDKLNDILNGSINEIRSKLTPLPSLRKTHPTCRRDGVTKETPRPNEEDDDAS